MGREAECECIWGRTASPVKALLESSELILRGAIRKRLPFSDLHEIQVNGEKLCFTINDEPVSLALGSVAATRWAHAITSPPTLASKLGIAPKTSVQMLGAVDDDALRIALEVAAKVSSTEGDLILARVETPDELNKVLEQVSDRIALRTPIWFIYPKGSGHDLSESSVISLVRARNMTDTKVAAVSPRLTALRFIKRKT